jgi:hypothetical protein
LTAAATIVVTIRAMALTSRREFIPLTVHRRVLFRRARPPKTQLNGPGRSIVFRLDRKL